MKTPMQTYRHPRGKKRMGTFNVLFEVAAYGDLLMMEKRQLRPEQVRRVALRGWVDSGSMKLILPKGVVNTLGLEGKSKVRVKYGNGKVVVRDEVFGVHVTLQGRSGVYTAIVEPNRDTALIGAIILEDLDFLVDCTKQRLVPRDPKMVTNAIE